MSDKETVNLQLDASVYDSLVKKAKIAHRSVNQILETLIAQAALIDTSDNQSVLIGQVVNEDEFQANQTICLNGIWYVYKIVDSKPDTCVYQVIGVNGSCLFLRPLLTDAYFQNGQNKENK